MAKSDYKTSYEFNIPYTIKSIQSIEIIKHLDIKPTIDKKMQSKSIINVTFKFTLNENMIVTYDPQNDVIPSTVFAIFYIINEHINYTDNNELKYQMRLLSDFIEWRFTKTAFQFGDDLKIVNLIVKTRVNVKDTKLSFLEMTIRKYIENYDISEMDVIISENDKTTGWYRRLT